MKLLKSLLFFIFISWCNFSFAGICVNTSSNYQMVGSILRSKSLANGAEIAFKKNNFLDYKFFSSKNDVELVQQIEHMAENKTCSVFLGFYTSRECLIVAPVFKKNKVIGLSPSCSHDALSSFSPYFYSATPSLSKFVDFMATYLNNPSHIGKTYVVYQPTDIYTVKGFLDFKKKFKYPIQVIPISKQGYFDINKFDFNQSEPVNIVFFTYPLPTTKIILALDQKRLISNHVTIVGESSWAYDFSVFGPLKVILKNSKSVLTPDIINWRNTGENKFIKDFFLKYHRNPVTMEVSNYDVADMATKCLKTSYKNKDYNQSLLQNCIGKELHYGVAGEFSFGKAVPFSNRKIYMINLLDIM